MIKINHPHQKPSFGIKLGLNISLIIISLMMASQVLAQTTTQLRELMQTANQQYEAGQLEPAIRTYEILHHDGLRHSALYYNLGNAYYQQQDIGRAVLNYRRAALLAPRDADVATNLALARRETVDQIADTPQGLLTGLAYLTESWLTVSESQLLALGLWTILMGWLAVVILWPISVKPTWLRYLGRLVTVSLFLPLILVLASLASRLYLAQQQPAIVIVAEAVDITTGPGTSERYPVEFRLHAGSEARLLDSQAGWRHITLANGLQGWLPAETIVFVNE